MKLLNWYLFVKKISPTNLICFLKKLGGFMIHRSFFFCCSSLHFLSLTPSHGRGSPNCTSICLLVFSNINFSNLSTPSNPSKPIDVHTLTPDIYCMHLDDDSLSNDFPAYFMSSPSDDLTANITTTAARA